MFRTHSAALAALLVLAVTSMAGAQEASSDTARHAKPPMNHDERQDARTISADSTRLHRDIALGDSIRAVVAKDHARTQAEEARVDSLKVVLAKARKTTPRDTAAVNRDLAALNQAREALENDVHRAEHERKLLASIEKRIRKESDATSDARGDVRADRSQQSLNRDERQDARTIAADSTRLHRDIALRDSIRTVVAVDHARTQAEQARIDSLKVALAKARKATPRDTAADLAALNQARETLENDVHRAEHERAVLASIDRRVTRESDATVDARGDLRADRSASAHPTSRTRHR
jgi:hypothetical protein